MMFLFYRYFHRRFLNLDTAKLAYNIGKMSNLQVALIFKLEIPMPEMHKPNF